MDWKLYYADDATFSSEDGSPADAPPSGVLLIAQIDPDTGWSVLCRASCYVYLVDAWQEADWFDVIDLCSTRLQDIKGVVIGRLVTKAEFVACYQRAQRDPELPQKSGYRPREYRG